MKKLSELAIVCAKRPDVLLQVYEGFVCVYVGVSPERGSMVAKCDDEEAIGRMLHELNSGKYAAEKKCGRRVEIFRTAA